MTPAESAAKFRARLRNQAPAALALLPAAIVVAVVYVGSMLMTARLSFSSSHMLPTFDWAGGEQYSRLFDTERFVESTQHIALFGVLFIVASLTLGFLLAVFIDQKVRFEALFRTIFLYPFSMSFIVTGLVWQWMLHPELGIEKTVRAWGFAHFTFRWIVDENLVVYTLVIAAVWQASGLVMAILLAGLRGVDAELWKATKIDAIPTWRVYWSVILPTLGPMLTTAAVLLAVSVAKLFDLVVAMTRGGPGISSEVPAKFIMDNFFGRSNVALGSAAATMLLVTVVAVVGPWVYFEHFRRKGVRA
ncbi:MAG: sugar ABC transporter permease [Hyphomicrobiales bacterium]|nr:sugar ABC transporter permease [Hyphomicrobiales bacterium]MDE2016307.1 sugar ABC transporter permease [Hyphomicrobiales bacterium]